ncbi:MAG: hypothetical protein ACHQO8_07550 [Vicinamibacterales bacterium]
MTPTTLDQPTPAAPERLAGSLKDKGLDALRHASHLSHEAQLLKSVAADAIEDGVHAVKRTAKTLQRDALDLRDDLTYRVKREPMKAMAIAFATGALAGLIVAVLLPKRPRGNARETGC